VRKREKTNEREKKKLAIVYDIRHLVSKETVMLQASENTII